jgi:hypothetical protein
MRPAASGWIQQTITVDNLVTGICEEEQMRHLAPLFGDFIDHLLKVFLRVICYSKNLSVVLESGIKKRFQLSKLSGTIRSPVATIENQDHILLSCKVRERNPRSIFALESEIRSRTSNSHTVEIRRRKVETIRRPQRSPILRDQESPPWEGQEQAKPT